MKWDDIIEIGNGVDEVEALDNLLPQYSGCDLTTVETDSEGNEYFDIYHPDGHFKVLIRRPNLPMTLAEAARIFPLAYSTLAQAAREGRLETHRSGATWLTTRAAIEEAIADGRLRPRRKAAAIKPRR